MDGWTEPPLPEPPDDPEAGPNLAAFHAENIGIMLRSVAEQRARKFPRRQPERLLHLEATDDGELRPVLRLVRDDEDAA